MIRFQKYHGTGNDFIIIDDSENTFTHDSKFIRELCDRHFGIGADGLITIKNSSGYDFRMIYYNADGLEGSMCGNGGRCAIAFFHSLGMAKSSVALLAIDGPHKGKIISQNPYRISLHMSDV